MKAVALSPADVLALDRRRRTTNAIISELLMILRESMNTGKPFLATPRWRSLLLQFEANRVRIEAFCQGNPTDNRTEVDAIIAALIEKGVIPNHAYNEDELRPHDA